MIISAWECKCGMYNKKLTSNLNRTQTAQDHKNTDYWINIKSVEVVCNNMDCTVVKTIKVVGA